MNQQSSKYSFQYRALTTVVIITLLILSIVGVFQFYRAKALAQEVENQYVRSFHDMTDYVRDVDVLLKKSLLATDAAQLSSISADVFMQAASAKACLAQLPTDNAHLDQTAKFLSQVGDYTSYLSSKVINDSVITDEEFENLKQLSSHASSVNSMLTELQDKLYTQNLSLKSVIGLTAHASEENSDEETPGLYQIEKEFQDYPSLIYDGPFSEHIEKMEPAALKDKREFTQEQALSIAIKFVGADRAGGLSFIEEGGGTIPSYLFSVTRDNGSQLTIDITKQGGMVLWMLDTEDVTAENIAVTDAVKQGIQFLNSHGFSGMKESYYEKNGNTVTINYAYVGHNVTMYSDLIKIKIALDDGRIIGFESRGYLMSHTEREIPPIVLSESSARSKINKHLNIDKVSLAMIPLESKREVLCYECHGSFNDQNYLIYINAQTGKEEKILLLIESPDGVLTM